MPTFTVDNLSDIDDGDHSAGNLSLREAIGLANANTDADTINFAATVAGGLITLSGSELALTQDLTIEGDIDGDGKSDITISGNQASRIFNASGSSSQIYLRGLTLTQGMGEGGAILASSIGALVIERSTIVGNLGTYLGGGLYAINSNVTIRDSTIAGNYALSSGGGIGSLLSSVTIVNSTIHKNDAKLDGGGIHVALSGLYANNSTITDNRADADGNGSGQGGVYLTSSAAYINNTVVAGNQTGSSGSSVPQEFDFAASTIEATNSFFGDTVTLTTDGGGNIGVCHIRRRSDAGSAG